MHQIVMYASFFLENFGFIDVTYTLDFPFGTCEMIMVWFFVHACVPKGPLNL